MFAVFHPILDENAYVKKKHFDDFGRRNVWMLNKKTIDRKNRYLLTLLPTFLKKISTIITTTQHSTSIQPSFSLQIRRNRKMDVETVAVHYGHVGRRMRFREIAIRCSQLFDYSHVVRDRIVA